MIAGHLREKNGHYYCVLSYVDYTGERKQIWKSTGLPVKGNKKRAEEMLSHLRKSFVVPRAPADYFDFSDRMLFTDFMRAWLEVVRTTVVPTTFGGYQTTVEKKFIPYFEKKNLALANVQAKDLQTFLSPRDENAVGNNGKTRARAASQDPQVRIPNGSHPKQSRRQG